MDQQQKAKPSGIPRPAPSRLPVLSKRASQNFDAFGSPKIEPTTSRLQKRSSIASLPRSSSRGPPPGAGNPYATLPPAPRPGAVINGVQTSLEKRAAAYGRPGGQVLRPSSRTNQRRLSSMPIAKPVPIATEDEENQDQLASLDSFRAASRQGSRSNDDLSPVEPEEPLEQVNDGPRSKKSSRLSLSDRTVESLSQLPATPATTRRTSSFFNPPESPMGPPPRPGSSLSRNDSSNGGSRPGTSDGNFARSASPNKASQRQSTSAKPATRTSIGGFGFNPASANRRSVSTNFTNRLQAARDGQEEDAPPSPSLRVRSRSPTKKPSINNLNAATQLKKQSSIASLRSVSPAKRTPSLSANSKAPKVTKGTLRGRPKTGETGIELSSGNAAKDTAEDCVALEAPPTAKKVASHSVNSSSAALRQQIAATKAAAKKERDRVAKPVDSPMTSSFTSQGNGTHEQDFENMHADPFNQTPKDEKHILKTRINRARTDGRLNIAALGLKQIPTEIMEMYSSKAMEESKVNWAEVVDVTKLIAADNELETIDDATFPDKSVEELEADTEEGPGSQFGGLELLDLHGNSLTTIPMGLRRLERLTTLNLAHNKLDNSALDVVAQITSLKELKLGNNNLSGNLTPSLCQLSNLEKLELQSNRLLSLPRSLKELVGLKVLNVSGNQLTNLPMDAIEAIQLAELDASSNALMGSFFPLGGDASHASLKILNLANNSLAALAFTETVGLPCIEEISLANNHLTAVPDVSRWTELRTLVASENKITELPTGLIRLKKLRNVNLTGNDIRLIDPQVGRMENLSELVLASNPLQQKKYLTMNCEDIKRDLLAKLEPEEPITDGEDAEEVFVDAEEIPHAPGSRARSSTAIMWTMKPGSVLDIASKGLSDEINDSLGSFLKDNEVRHLLFQQNRLTSIPPALWLGQDIRVLDLSGNALGSEYLSEDLELPALTELRLTQCRISSLEPLTQSLKAPKLETLNLSSNRLSGTLPVLRQAYPALTTLFAGENKFTSISADALRGLHTVNLSSNDLSSLPAEVGLLWDEGLRAFEVRGNAFRVPSYTVLEKGTEAVMRWLMNKIPAGEQTQRVIAEDM